MRKALINERWRLDIYALIARLGLGYDDLGLLSAP